MALGNMSRETFDLIPVKKAASHSKQELKESGPVNDDTPILKPKHGKSKETVQGSNKVKDMYIASSSHWKLGLL